MEIVKAEGIYHLQTCTIKNNKGSLSARRKIIPDGNMNLHEMKTRNGIHNK